MGSKSDYLEKEVLDHVLGGGDYSRPTTVWLALYTVTPTDSGGGTEVSGGAYVRKSVANNATNWPAATGVTATKSNGVSFTFAQATASWGTVVAFAIFDASAAGNMLYWGAVSPSKQIGSGDTAKFAIGDIDITED